MGQAGDEVELGLDTTASGKVAPVWAALLTGRVPNLRFDDLDEDAPERQRFHVEVPGRQPRGRLC